MRSRLITVLMLVVGIIHLLPIAGLLGPEALKTLYRIDITSPGLDILMRHRAVLFVLLGSFFCYAAFKPNYQPVAFLMSGISVISFLVLYLITKPVNEALKKVAVVDVVALICLLIAAVLYYKSSKQPNA